MTHFESVRERASSHTTTRSLTDATLENTSMRNKKPIPQRWATNTLGVGGVMRWGRGVSRHVHSAFPTAVS